MASEDLIRKGLHEQGLLLFETDIPYIQHILYTMKQTQAPLEAFPYLNSEVPITVVDKELLR